MPPIPRARNLGESRYGQQVGRDRWARRGLTVSDADALRSIAHRRTIRGEADADDPAVRPYLGTAHATDSRDHPTSVYLAKASR